MAMNMTDLVNGSVDRTNVEKPTWEGTAIFDVLMKAVNENINIQYELTRITGSDYATVYLGAMETCIKEATNLLLQKAIVDKDLEVKTQQIISMQMDDDIKIAQSAKDLELKDKDLEVKYVQQIKLDKEAAAMGLDSVVKSMNQNTTPGYIYIPQYKKG